LQVFHIEWIDWILPKVEIVNFQFPSEPLAQKVWLYIACQVASTWAGSRPKTNRSTSSWIKAAVAKLPAPYAAPALPTPAIPQTPSQKRIK
jgi:hypothetical protein